jgi:hypothetical protein
MRRFLVVATAALLTVTLAVGTVAAVGNQWKAPPFAAIGIQSLNATGGWDETADFRNPLIPSEVALFVETGSLSQQCLATLNELRADSNVEMVFCAPRFPTFDGGVTRLAGLWIHVLFASDPGEDLSLWINAYQENAKSWGTPRYCGAENGC